MSTTGIIQTDANWNLTSSGYLRLNYSNLTRTNPQYTKTITFGTATNGFTLFSNNEITDAGIYLLTIQGDFNSTPWVLRFAAYIPMGYQQLANGQQSSFQAPHLHSLHADNGINFLLFFEYLTVTTNYHCPGLRMTTLNNCNPGTIIVKMYKIVGGM